MQFTTLSSVKLYKIIQIVVSCDFDALLSILLYANLKLGSAGIFFLPLVGLVFIFVFGSDFFLVFSFDGYKWPYTQWFT